jgi:ketosteroid isomerase-like protein
MQRCYDTAANALHRIQKINEKIEQALLAKNAGAVTAFYAETLTFFPEYKPAIFDTKV